MPGKRERSHDDDGKQNNVISFAIVLSRVDSSSLSINAYQFGVCVGFYGCWRQEETMLSHSFV